MGRLNGLRRIPDFVAITDGIDFAELVFQRLCEISSPCLAKGDDYCIRIKQKSKARLFRGEADGKGGVVDRRRGRTGY